MSMMMMMGIDPSYEIDNKVVQTVECSIIPETNDVINNAIMSGVSMTGSYWYVTLLADAYRIVAMSNCLKDDVVRYLPHTSEITGYVDNIEGADMTDVLVRSSYASILRILIIGMINMSYSKETSDEEMITYVLKSLGYKFYKNWRHQIFTVDNHRSGR